MTNSRYQRRHLASADVETLQTDTMRFMAIIAFCLLVVFIPIVQSMESHAPKERSNVVEVPEPEETPPVPPAEIESATPHAQVAKVPVVKTEPLYTESKQGSGHGSRTVEIDYRAYRTLVAQQQLQLFVMTPSKRLLEVIWSSQDDDFVIRPGSAPKEVDLMTTLFLLPENLRRAVKRKVRDPQIERIQVLIVMSEELRVRFRSAWSEPRTGSLVIHPDGSIEWLD